MQPLLPVLRVVLTGFMGSGKTTVGRLLAEALGWEFLDLDREVERYFGLGVPAIFAQHGEQRFRELEAEVLSTLLRRKHLVLALGGGAPEFEATASQLRSSPATCIVYLSAPFPVLTVRCRAQAAQPGAVHRPLMENVAAAGERFTRREPLYQQLAHASVETAALSATESATAVLRAIETVPRLPMV